VAVGARSEGETIEERAEGLTEIDPGELKYANLGGR